MWVCSVEMGTHLASLSPAVKCLNCAALSHTVSSTTLNGRIPTFLKIHFFSSYDCDTKADWFIQVSVMDVNYSSCGDLVSKEIPTLAETVLFQIFVNVYPLLCKSEQGKEVPKID